MNTSIHAQIARAARFHGAFAAVFLISVMLPFALAFIGGVDSESFWIALSILSVNFFASAGAWSALFVGSTLLGLVAVALD